jgi:hypothetical protein
MKPSIALDHGVKVCISLLLSLNLMAILNRPTSAAQGQFDQLPAETLYQQALSAEFIQRDKIWAAIYMYAYVQRNAPEYANNYYSRKDFVDSKLQEYFASTNQARALLAKVNSDEKACKCLSGGQTASCAIFAQGTPEAPPDAVVVCTQPQYQGTCRVLFIGSYPTYEKLGVPNDSVASVLVGSQVKITLYMNRLGYSPMLSLTQDDADLWNNLISGKYPWSRNVSTARVERR